jgi:RimJ/RimL family protein N-acetyltransferase
MGGDSFRFRPLTVEDARLISSWRYEEPYHVHEATDAELLLDAERLYLGAFSEADELVGFCCFGEAARVAGLKEEADVLDVGGDLRPDLTGAGLGAPFLRAVCALGAQRFQPLAFRIVVAAFDRRARYVAAALGFEQVGLASAAGREYVVLRRPADPSPDG